MDLAVSSNNIDFDCSCECSQDTDFRDVYTKEFTIKITKSGNEITNTSSDGFESNLAFRELPKRTQQLLLEEAPICKEECIIHTQVITEEITKVYGMNESIEKKILSLENRSGDISESFGMNYKYDPDCSYRNKKGGFNGIDTSDQKQLMRPYSDNNLFASRERSDIKTPRKPFLNAADKIRREKMRERRHSQMLEQKTCLSCLYNNPKAGQSNWKQLANSVPYYTRKRVFYSRGRCATCGKTYEPGTNVQGYKNPYAKGPSPYVIHDGDNMLFGAFPYSTVNDPMTRKSLGTPGAFQSLDHLPSRGHGPNTGEQSKFKMSPRDNIDNARRTITSEVYESGNNEPDKNFGDNDRSNDISGVDISHSGQLNQNRQSPRNLKGDHEIVNRSPEMSKQPKNHPIKKISSKKFKTRSPVYDKSAHNDTSADTHRSAHSQVNNIPIRRLTDFQKKQLAREEEEAKARNREPTEVERKAKPREQVNKVPLRRLSDFERLENQEDMKKYSEDIRKSSVLELPTKPPVNEIPLRKLSDFDSPDEERPSIPSYNPRERPPKEQVNEIPLRKLSDFEPAEEDKVSISSPNPREPPPKEQVNNIPLRRPSDFEPPKEENLSVQASSRKEPPPKEPVNAIPLRRVSSFERAENLDTDGIVMGKEPTPMRKESLQPTGEKKNSVVRSSLSGETSASATHRSSLQPLDHETNMVVRSSIASGLTSASDTNVMPEDDDVSSSTSRTSIGRQKKKRAKKN